MKQEYINDVFTERIQVSEVTILSKICGNSVQADCTSGDCKEETKNISYCMLTISNHYYLKKEGMKTEKPTKK